jgi:hypothetical protein
VAFGDVPLKRGDQGAAVVELQLRLAGFRGTVWDGKFGPGTELQVVCFQRDYMRQSARTGQADRATFDALFAFESEFPIAVDPLRCPCGSCEGFGRRRFKGEYAPGEQTEKNYRYEYPGMHKAILHSFRAAAFYLQRAGFPAPVVSSGYRCWTNNEQKGRTSTNHMGKAIDLDFPLAAGEDKRDDQIRCDRGRGVLVELANFQIGWTANNRKALEPKEIAPTWIHMDVRNYERRYLAERFFVRPRAGATTL